MALFRLLLEYDGGDFAGWQLQPEGQRTVQGVLVDAARQITGQPAYVKGSGRTDAGVHAEGQVASLRVETHLEPESLRRALNGVLPADVAVRAVALAMPGFDPQRDAERKRYRYQIWNHRSASPLRRRRFAHVPQPLDLAAMRKAAGALEGEHDFRCFQAAGSSVETSVRTLFAVELSGEPGGEIWLALEGSGFLRHMVRNVAGTLIEVGLGRREAGEMGALLAGRDRRRAGATAPAQGLTLAWVRYPGATDPEAASQAAEGGATPRP